MRFIQWEEKESCHHSFSRQFSL